MHKVYANIKFLQTSCLLSLSTRVVKESLCQTSDVLLRMLITVCVWGVSFVCVCVYTQVVCRFLCEEATETLTEKQFIPAVRKFIIKHLLAGFFSFLKVSQIISAMFCDFVLLNFVPLQIACCKCVCVCVCVCVCLLSRWTQACGSAVIWPSEKLSGCSAQTWSCTENQRVRLFWSPWAPSSNYKYIL